MTVYRCRHCDVHIEWLLTRFGVRLPFEHFPVPVEDDTGDRAWVPGLWTVNRRERPSMAPLSHYGAEKRAAVRRVVLVHNCPGHRALVNDVVTIGERSLRRGPEVR